MTYYILDDNGQPVRCPDVETWGAWFQQAGRTRVVQQDYAESENTTVGVSTVFLGLDHNFSGRGAPVLWESLIFGTTLDGEMRRYTSREAALRGHAELLERV